MIDVPLTTVTAVRHGDWVASVSPAHRSWFRYHHLFADLLRLELRRTASCEVIALHKAAPAVPGQEDRIAAAACLRRDAGGRRSSASPGLLVCAVVALSPVPGEGDKAANHVGGQPRSAREVPQRRILILGMPEVR